MSRYHRASGAAESGLYVLTVRAPDGSVARRRGYRTCEGAGLSSLAPTMGELAAGYRGEVRRAGSLCRSFEPVNPKVLPLVGSLLAAGVATTGSGDMYGDDLVYVDLASEWEAAAAAAELPPGWVVTPTLIDASREALGLPPQPPGLSGEPVEGVQPDHPVPSPTARLSRRGHGVAREEAEAVVAALLAARDFRRAGCGVSRYHAALSLLSSDRAKEDIPEAVMRRAVEMRENVTNPLLVGDTDMVNGWLIETHTIGCRNAADEPEERWWDSHWAIYDEYSADSESVVLGDPEDGVFTTITRAREPELRLECRCADDRGAGYKDESELTDDDVLCIEDYEETRAAQLAMEREASARGIACSVSDSDDRDSRHSDAYVYFPPSRLAEVAEMLDAVGLSGDILDVPAGFPSEEAERAGREYGWTVERGEG